MKGFELEDSPVWLIAVIFVVSVLLPIGFIWSGMKSIFNNFRFRKNADLVIGKVVGFNGFSSDNTRWPSSKYQPVFEFTGSNGEKMHCGTAAASTRYNFKIDSEHKIWVNLARPQFVQLLDDRVYSKALLMIGISTFVLLAGGSFMFSLG